MMLMMADGGGFDGIAYGGAGAVALDKHSLPWIQPRVAIDAHHYFLLRRDFGLHQIAAIAAEVDLTDDTE